MNEFILDTDTIHAMNAAELVAAGAEETPAAPTGWAYVETAPAAPARKMTLKSARAEARKYGATVKPDGCGEYVVRRAGVEYFTPDLGDAVETARAMANGRQVLPINPPDAENPRYGDDIG